jgi:hypothetical protein
MREVLRKLGLFPTRTPLGTFDTAALAQRVVQAAFGWLRAARFSFIPLVHGDRRHKRGVGVCKTRMVKCKASLKG